MNKKSLCAILFTSCMLALTGCSENSPSSPGDVTTLKPESGRFGMSSLGKLEKRTASASVAEGAQVKFNLGQIRGSSGFFFLLYNVGATPITGVSLSVNSKAFSVFPSNIDTLIPGSDVGMLPIVKIAAFHGTPYDGVGNRPLLPQGKNECVLHIQGKSKTAAGGDTTIAMDAVMGVDALVMGLSLEAKNGPMDITKTLDMSNPSEVAKDVQFIKECKSLITCKTECLGDSVVKLNNAGNVALKCRVYRSTYIQQTNSYLIDTLMDSTITAQGSLNITLNGDALNVAYLFDISGDNAVADPMKLLLNANGKFYARIQKGTVQCLDAQVEQHYESFLKDHEKSNCGKIWALLDNRYIAYTESYNNGDSVITMLYDLLSEQLVTSFTGNKMVVRQTNNYTGEYLKDFESIIMYMFLNDVKSMKYFSPKITGGGSSNWNLVPGSIKIVNWIDYIQ